MTEASGRATQVQRLANHDGRDDAGVHEAARHGTSGSSEALPHRARIQSLFGPHDVSGVKAHTDTSAQAGARAMGAEAFAVGDQVAFAGPPSLHTAAHEAAHVVQQRAGVQLKGGVGAVGDPYEQHADAVADRVEKGESAVDLLDQVAAGGGGSTTAIQRAPGPASAGNDPAASSARKARAQAALKSVVDRAAAKTGGGATNGYDLTGKQKNEATEYQNWKVAGVGAGNRAGDMPDKDGKVKNASQGGISPAQVNLSSLDLPTTNAGNGAYHQHGAAVKGWSDKRKDKMSLDGGTPTVDIWGGSATAGASEMIGARANTDAKGGWGKASAGANADLVAEAGANVNAKLNSDGFTAGAAASARAGAEASATASYESPELAIKGVDKPLTAGVDGNANVFAGAKVGASGQVVLTKDAVGVKGSAGAFAGAEASIEGTAHVGPVSGTVGVSGMAGAGIGADGSIMYENGHLKIGGRLYAAIGLGGSVSTSVDIDLKQAVQLGIVTAKEAYDLSDADHDGRITLNDGAAHAANAMTGTAKAVDSGVDATLHTLDANHDGKIDGKDVSYAAGQAWDATKHGANAAWDGTKHGAGVAWDATKHGATVAVDATKQGANKIKGALDHDGDGKLELSDIKADLGDAGKAVLRAGQHAMESVTQGVAHARDVISHGVEKTAQAAHNAADLNHDGKVDAKDVRKLAQDAVQLVETMAQDVNAHAQAVVKQAHDAMDLNHDGKVDAKDAAVAKQRVATRVEAMKKAASESLHSAVEAGHSAVDRIKAEIKLTAKRVFDAADLNHDGKVDAKDAAVARERVAATAKKVGTAVHDAADLNHDGKVDAKDAVAGAKQAGAAVQRGATFVAKEVADGAKQFYDGATAQVKQAGATLKKGFDDAKQILSGTWAKIKSFS